MGAGIGAVSASVAGAVGDYSSGNVRSAEVCEFFGVNPYLLISSGCMLMAAQDGNHLVRELEKAGIKATIIGKATAGNDRVLLNEDERRFLEPPKTDELYKVIGR